MSTDDQKGHVLARRPVLRLLAGGAVAVAGIGGLARLSPRTDRSDGPSSLVLSSHDASGVASLDIPLDNRRLTASGGGRWQTEQLPTSTHSMVALTWLRASGHHPRIRIRSRIDGTWQEWRTMPTLHDLPDPDSAEGGAGTAGTDLVWIGAADGIQVDVQGDRPEHLTLVLLHPDRQLSALSAHHARGRRRKGKRPKRVPHPELFRRRDWGAKRGWRPSGISYNSSIRQVHIHHTVNSNSYGKDDVPGLIRGMYRYHTHNLGWSDIGYNFLVDRFGRTWVGRAGGWWLPVRGAHTLGFNATSCGVAVIGNYETARPNKAVLDALAALAAWKLDRYDTDPGGRVTVTSEGSDRYAAGRSVRLSAIDGHRDTNDTACPGRYIYEALPRVRRRAQVIARKYGEQA